MSKICYMYQRDQKFTNRFLTIAYTFVNDTTVLFSYAVNHTKQNGKALDVFVKSTGRTLARGRLQNLGPRNNFVFAATVTNKRPFCAIMKTVANQKTNMPDCVRRIARQWLMSEEKSTLTAPETSPEISLHNIDPYELPKVNWCNG